MQDTTWTTNGLSIIDPNGNTRLTVTPSEDHELDEATAMSVAGMLTMQAESQPIVAVLSNDDGQQVHASFVGQDALHIVQRIEAMLRISAGISNDALRAFPGSITQMAEFIAFIRDAAADPDTWAEVREVFASDNGPLAH